MKRAGYLATLGSVSRSPEPRSLRPPRLLFGHEPALAEPMASGEGEPGARTRLPGQAANQATAAARDAAPRAAGPQPGADAPGRTRRPSDRPRRDWDPAGLRMPDQDTAEHDRSRRAELSEPSVMPGRSVRAPHSFPSAPTQREQPREPEANAPDDRTLPQARLPHERLPDERLPNERAGTLDRPPVRLDGSASSPQRLRGKADTASSADVLSPSTSHASAPPSQGRVAPGSSRRPTTPLAPHGAMPEPPRAGPEPPRARPRPPLATPGEPHPGRQTDESLTTAAASRSRANRTPQIHIGAIEVVVVPPPPAASPPERQARVTRTPRPAPSSRGASAQRWFGLAQR